MVALLPSTVARSPVRYQHRARFYQKGHFGPGMAGFIKCLIFFSPYLINVGPLLLQFPLSKTSPKKDDII